MDLPKKHKIIEIAFIVITISALAAGWYVLSSTFEEADEYVASGMPIEARGRIPIPYFLLIMDRSASMEFEESDPENYQKEALKQAIRLIYWNGKQLHDLTGFYPRVRVIDFSGAPSSITGKDEWSVLYSEQDIADFDRNIEAVLGERSGQFTDINSCIEYVKTARDSVPEYLGDEESAYPVSVMAVLFTDGEIYPNYLNPVNHRTEEKWENFKEKASNLAEMKLGEDSGEQLIEKLDEKRWLDPVDWAETHFPDQPSKDFRKAYYGLNEKHMEESDNYEYAKKNVYQRLHGQLQSISAPPPLRLNTIALLKGDGRENEINYLKQWSEGLGFFYNIEEAESLGPLFVDMMSPYLNSYSEEFLLTDRKNLGPFGKDVASVQIFALFKDKLGKADQDKLVKLKSPGGKKLDPEFNSVFAHSRTYYLAEDTCPDFYDQYEWEMDLEPVNVNGKLIDSANCFMVVNQKYMLEMKKAEGCPKNNCTRYTIYLIDPETKKPLPIDNFSAEGVPPYEIERMDQGKLHEVEFTRDEKTNDVHVDFIDWPSGVYNVKATLTGKGLKTKSKFLKGLSITGSVEVGPRIWFKAPSTDEELTELSFGGLDRE